MPPDPPSLACCARVCVYLAYAVEYHKDLIRSIKSSALDYDLNCSPWPDHSKFLGFGPVDNQLNTDYNWDKKLGIWFGRLSFNIYHSGMLT